MKKKHTYECPVCGAGVLRKAQYRWDEKKQDWEFWCFTNDVYCGDMDCTWEGNVKDAIVRLK